MSKKYGAAKAKKARFPNRRRNRPESSKRVQLAEQKLSGILRLQKDGSGFLEASSGEKVYVPAHELRNTRDGAQLTVQLHAARKGRVRGKVVSHDGYSNDKAVGVLCKRGKIYMVDPSPGGPPLIVRKLALHDASVGDAVVVRITREAQRSALAAGEIESVLGRAGEPKVELEMLVRSLRWPLEFSAECLQEADGAPPVSVEAALADGRRDLRRVEHVTIDGEDARDFDDAVAVRQEPNGYRVWVSIADVSHYVHPGSTLDAEAQARGTSVYFPHRVLPMLPERLSNGLCSLRPQVPRLTLTCEMVVSKDGHRSDVRVYPSLIQSSARLTYNEVEKSLQTPDNGFAHQALVRDLAEAAECLRKRRLQRGAIDLDIPEAQVVLDHLQYPRYIRARERLEAHRIIEDLMIAANESVAELLLESEHGGVFRIHEAPDPLRLQVLAQWAGQHGIRWEPAAGQRPKGLAALAARTRQLPQAAVGQSLLLRSMAQARYAATNVGHYGLASKAYLHFTSPIRRYPDLVVHRCLKRLWAKKKPLSGMQPIAEHTSVRERRAIDAERAVLQLFSVMVAADRVGETMDAVVTGVHRLGAFVRTTPLMLEGLLPVEALGVHQYEVVEAEVALRARRSGHRLAMGDTVQVRIDSVSMAERRINFVLAEQLAKGASSRGKSARKRTVCV